MDVKDGVTLAIASVGAVLGCFNTWRAWIGDRVRLRVKTSFAVTTAGQRCIAVDAVNLSAFPVTVTHVGFTLSGTDRHVQCVLPLLVPGGGNLPKRLESRTALTVLQPLGAFDENTLSLLERAYVKTACGLTIKSRHDLAVQLVHAALAAQDVQGV